MLPTLKADLEASSRNGGSNSGIPAPISASEPRAPKGLEKGVDHVYLKPERERPQAVGADDDLHRDAYAMPLTTLLRALQVHAPLVVSTPAALWFSRNQTSFVWCRQASRAAEKGHSRRISLWGAG